MYENEWDLWIDGNYPARHRAGSPQCIYYQEEPIKSHWPTKFTCLYSPPISTKKRKKKFNVGFKKTFWVVNEILGENINFGINKSYFLIS